MVKYTDTQIHIYQKIHNIIHQDAARRIHKYTCVGRLPRRWETVKPFTVKATIYQSGESAWQSFLKTVKLVT